MTDNTEKKPNSTNEWLLSQIEAFLEANDTISPERFGWLAIEDASLVKRLRDGGDVTTKKLDQIIRYLGKYQTNKKEN